MKIAVIGANGKAGNLIVAEAVARGHEVTAIVRSENKSQAQKVINKDVLEVSRAELENFDVVVNAFGAWTEETLPGHKKIAEHLLRELAGTKVRLFVVGGAGSLWVNAEHTVQLMNTPDFPEIFMAVANASAEAYNLIIKNTEVNWTYMTPPADFRVDVEIRGAYTLGNGEFTLNERGESMMSYADYALAMLDVIEAGNTKQQVVSVNGK